MAENPQDLGIGVPDTVVGETESATAPAGDETEPENSTHSEDDATTAAPRATRSGGKRPATVLQDTDVEGEVRNRATRAATEYFMKLGSEDALTIADLQRKHGLVHRTQLTRAIQRMRPFVTHFALAREFQNSLRVQAEIGGETATQTEEVTADLTDSADNYRGSGQPFAVYNEAMVHAASLVVEKGRKPAQAAEQVRKKFKIKLTGAAIKKHVQRHGVGPVNRAGRKYKLDEEAENQLVEIVLLMRKARLPTWGSIMKKICKGLISGTKYEGLFPNGEVSGSWWRRFVRRHSDKLAFSNSRKHELQRERWTTAENIATFYDNLENLLVELGIAVVNPQYDPTARWRKGATDQENSKCARVLIVKPDRLCSVDETEVTTNQSGGSHMGRTSSERIVRANDDFDHGETLTNKTSQRATMYGGSVANGFSLRPFVIFNCTPKLNWIVGAPVSTWINLTSHLNHTCACDWNESGGSTAEVFLNWLKCQFGDLEGPDGQPLLHDGPLFKASKEDPVVVLLDGHGSHWSKPVLEYCIEGGIHLVLRPPHTSHVSQGEDVINFRKLKHKIRVACGELLAIRAFSVLRGDSGRPDNVVLTNKDLMECVKVPWEEAFAISSCRSAWAVTGFEPATRRVYWELHDAEVAKRLQSERTQMATGLNVNNFTLNSIAPEKTLARKELEENLATELEGMTDEQRDQLLDEVGERRVGGALNSSQLWRHPGGVTGRIASKLVFDDAQGRAQKQQETETRRAEKQTRDAERRQAAAPMIEHVKAIVRQKGWQTGGRGCLTAEMLKDVLLVMNAPAKAGEKVADLSERVKNLLQWKQDVGFPGDAPAPQVPQQAPPVPDLD